MYQQYFSLWVEFKREYHSNKLINTEKFLIYLIYFYLAGVGLVWVVGLNLAVKLKK